jgi:hypothetical protein
VDALHSTDDDVFVDVSDRIDVCVDDLQVNVPSVDQQ